MTNWHSSTRPLGPPVGGIRRQQAMIDPNRLLYYLVRLPLFPAATARELSRDPKKLRYGFAGTMLMGGMYTVTLVVAYRRGFGAVEDPWLPIPAEDYYFWESFFAVPVYIVLLTTASGMTQLVSRALGGGWGTFEDAFAIVNLAEVLPTFLLMWVPETALFVLVPGRRATELGGFGFMPDWFDAFRLLAVPIWYLIAAARALSTTHRFSGVSALVAVGVGMVPAVIIAVTYIR